MFRLTYSQHQADCKKKKWTLTSAWVWHLELCSCIFMWKLVTDMLQQLGECSRKLQNCICIKLCRRMKPDMTLAHSLTHSLTHSMQHSPSWEANRFSASQEIPRILWTPKVHYRIQNSPPPVPILILHDPVHTWGSILILSSLLRLDLSSGLFPSGFPTKKRGVTIIIIIIIIVYNKLRWCRRCF
jgi:hypothetical protein